MDGAREFREQKELQGRSGLDRELVIPFYSPKISRDFHRVLCGLVDGFRQAIINFSELLSSQDLRADTDHIDRVGNTLERLELWSRTLHDMVQSSAIVAHINAIGRNLPLYFASLGDDEVEEASADEEGEID